MRFSKGMLLIAAIVVALAPVAGIACEKHAAAETASAKPCGAKSGCSKSDARAASLAANAHGGCSKSTAQLVAMAKGSKCSTAATLAAKAEAGDEQATKALIAMYHEQQEADGTRLTDEPSLAELAVRADAGCSKSEAAMIARAKSSGCAKTSGLAAKAEGGCAKSKAALVAMLQEPAELADN